MGNGGNSSVGGFVQNLVKDTLPLHELGKSVGLELPAFLGKPMEGKTAASSPAPAADAPAAYRNRRQPELAPSSPPS